MSDGDRSGGGEGQSGGVDRSSPGREAAPTTEHSGMRDGHLSGEEHSREQKGQRVAQSLNPFGDRARVSALPQAGHMTVANPCPQGLSVLVGTDSNY